jgi:hypothetical protein
VSANGGDRVFRRHTDSETRAFMPQVNPDASTGVMVGGSGLHDIIRSIMVDAVAQEAVATTGDKQSADTSTGNLRYQVRAACERKGV